MYTSDTVSGSSYYAISFRMQVLFIDKWTSENALYFRVGNSSVYPAGVYPNFTYFYNNYGAIGEQQCGTNAYDYVLTVAGSIPLIPTGASTSYTVYISSNIPAF